MRSRQGVGRFGEREAAAHLVEMGYRIREQGYRAVLGGVCIGEIDVIAEEGEYLVFAEVKTRSGLDRGLPREAIGRGKQRKMTRAAALYANALGEERPWRFDVIEVILLPGGSTEVHVLRDAFQADERDLQGLES
ncbi:MAG TPA: YraN family protein [Armatimonadota bacterium]|nr:YraN family protein [Armatimonadota bacterium]HOM83268.1 YraN family protein [Armatimonadota bacterium]HPO73157.1 YraN family protein [Armatimonadota bacterium]